MIHGVVPRYCMAIAAIGISYCVGRFVPPLLVLPALGILFGIEYVLIRAN